MIGRWREMSPEQRFQAQIVFAFLLVGMYGLVFYPISHGRFEESKKMLHRRQDRIEKRAGFDEKKIGSFNPRAISAKIEKVDEQLKELSVAFDELDTGFAPLESSDVRQQLMLEISTLAERTGVELVSVSRKEISRGKEKAVVPVDPVLGRPLLVVTANARFGQLLDFLHGLKNLSFHVSVMNLKICSQHLKGERGAEAHLPEGAIFVSLEMSM